MPGPETADLLRIPIELLQDPTIKLSLLGVAGTVSLVVAGYFWSTRESSAPDPIDAALLDLAKHPGVPRIGMPLNPWGDDQKAADHTPNVGPHDRTMGWWSERIK